MTTYHFQAVDAKGRPAQGSLEAVEWSGAEAQLNERGYRDVRQVAAPGVPAEIGKLRSAEAVELAGYLSDAAQAQMPLPQALRALAVDARSRPLASVLAAVAEKLEAGLPLDRVFEALATRLPAYTGEMIVAGARSGRLGETLDQVLAERRGMDLLSQQYWQAVAYPVVLLLFLVAWVLFIAVWVIPQMQLDDVMADYSSGVAPTAQRTIEFARITPRLIAASAMAIVVVAGLVRVFSGAAGVSRLVSCLPLIGRAWRYRGLTEVCGLLAAIMAQRQPLPEALRLTARAARDPAMRGACERLAAGVSQGRSLSDCLRDEGSFSPLLVQLVAWGEQRNQLEGTLVACRRMYFDRFEWQVQLIRLVVPPAAFLAIAGVALFVAGSVFSVFTSLLTWLSSYAPVQQAGQVLDMPGVELSGLASVFVAGATLLYCANLLGMLASSATATRGILRFCGQVLLVAGLTGICAAIPGVWGVVGWFALAVVGVRGAMHFRATERRNLLGVVQLAAERQLPLPAAIHAFAAEIDSGLAGPAQRLAAILHSGVPLVMAASLASGALPPEAALALKVGDDTGDLPGALRAAAPSAIFERTLIRPVALRLAYILPALVCFLIFMKVKIEPALVKIFADFDIALPPITQLALGLPGTNWGWYPQSMVQGWGTHPLLWAAAAMIATIEVSAVVLLVLLLVLLPLMWMQWRGSWRAWLPVLGPIVNWLDLAPILRLLALEVRHARPQSAIHSIVRLHPKAAMRKRWRGVEQDLNNGVAWNQSLLARRLLGAGDLAVLAAAERAGNLSWALNETADSLERRANYRLQALGQVLMPLLLLPVALVAGVLIVGYFAPLVTLVRSLC